MSTTRETKQHPQRIQCECEGRSKLGCLAERAALMVLVVPVRRFKLLLLVVRCEELLVRWLKKRKIRIFIVKFLNE